LSQSQPAKHTRYHIFSGLDFLFAVLAHVLIVGIIATIAWWQSNHAPTPPLKRIEVSMISAQDLKTMQHQAHKTQKKVKTVKKIHKPKVKAAVKQKIKPKKKPVLKLKPKTKKAVKSTKKVKEDPDFDPFAPVESSSNKTTKTRSKPKPDMADIMGKQLSTQEIDRYIAMMQAAVQSHWKVPGGINENTPDPLVEMILQRNGRLLSVKILESSGNSALDQTLIAAIRAAAPFRVPSKQFESFRNNRIRFHPL